MGMWQPFNGLQIFTPGNWKTEITSEGQGYLDELAVDGKKAPKAAMPHGSTFRIKCGDDGFNKPSAAEDVSLGHSKPAGQQKANADDLKRARSKIPRSPYKGG